MRLAAWNITRRLERSSRASSNSAKAETAESVDAPSAVTTEPARAVTS
jgi:hypothetical protein